jgi:cardiolipin synthase
MAMLRHLPNLITFLRIVACVPLARWIADDEARAAFWLAFAVGASDVLDGFLARRFRWQSELGGRLDPVADKLFLVCAFVSLWLIGALPTWLIVLVMVRDLVIVAGAIAYHNLVEPVPGEPSALGKASTVAQVMLALIVLARLAGLPMPLFATDALIGIVAMLAVVSGASYVWIWTARARRVLRERGGRS